jgi:hypothetical protein
MTGKDPMSVAELIGRGRLGTLAREAERRRGVADRVRRLLPPEEAEHLVGASTTEQGELVLVMDSPVWAARVRYRAEELGAKQLRVKVVPKKASEPF